MSGKKENTKDKWTITFANEPSKEAIEAFNKAVSEILLEHILKEDKGKS